MGKERRKSVRAPLFAEVHFRVMDVHEYEAVRDKGDSLPPCRFMGGAVRPVSPGEEEDYPVGRVFGPNLIDILINIEDKLDRVLKLLSKDDNRDEGIFAGYGIDISGDGMKMACDKAVKVGQVLKISFRIFRSPIISLEVFGKVVRVRPVERDGGRHREVAVDFLDLAEESREWIIAYVFQMQREAIRSRKKR